MPPAPLLPILTDIPLVVGVSPSTLIADAATTDTGGALRLDLVHALDDTATCTLHVEVLPPGDLVWHLQAALGPYYSRTVSGRFAKPDATPTWGLSFPFARLAGTKLRLRTVSVVGAWRVTLGVR